MNASVNDVFDHLRLGIHIKSNIHKKFVQTVQANYSTVLQSKTLPFHVFDLPCKHSREAEYQGQQWHTCLPSMTPHMVSHWQCLSADTRHSWPCEDITHTPSGFPVKLTESKFLFKKLHLNFTNPRITILWYARRLDTISVVQNFTYTTNFHIAHCLNSHCHFYEYLCYWYCFHKRHPARKNLCQFPNVLLLTELTQNPSPTSSNFETKLAKQQRRK